jgi:DNA-binding transcriptional LysR family regulator
MPRPSASAPLAAPGPAPASGGTGVGAVSLDAARVLVEVVRAQSFSEAARRLGMPKSTVSLRVSSLEAALGVSLLHRSTRVVQPTAAGSLYFDAAVRSLEGLDRAAAALCEEQSSPTGTLRVAAIGVGNGVVGDLFATYLQRYPQVRLEAVFGPARVDLVRDKIDVALRFGQLGDSAGLVAKRVGAAYRKVVASAAYLQTHAPITHPRDLAQHAFLGIPGQRALRLQTASGHRVTVPLQTRFEAGFQPALIHQATRGLGVACVPISLVATAIHAGELVDVLPDWRSPDDVMHIVYVKQAFVPPHVRAFVELAQETLRPPHFVLAPALPRRRSSG